MRFFMHCAEVHVNKLLIPQIKSDFHEKALKTINGARKEC